MVTPIQTRGLSQSFRHQHSIYPVPPPKTAPQNTQTPARRILERVFPRKNPMGIELWEGILPSGTNGVEGSHCCRPKGFCPTVPNSATSPMPSETGRGGRRNPFNRHPKRNKTLGDLLPHFERGLARRALLTRNGPRKATPETLFRLHTVPKWFGLAEMVGSYQPSSMLT